MRTDRELTALFAGAIADDPPDPAFLDELFEVMVNEVVSMKLPGTVGTASGEDVPRRVERVGRRFEGRTRRSLGWPLAIAAAVVLATVTGALVLRPHNEVGPPGPSGSPSPTARTWQVAPSATFSTFTSKMYGFRVGYPANWKSHESAGRLDQSTYPYDFGGGVDYLSATSPNVLDPGLIIAGPRLTSPTDLSAWMARIAQLQATAIGCGGPDSTEPATVAGLMAQIDTWQACPEFILWAGFVRGGIGYHVLLIDEFATDNPPLQAADHAMFLRILGTFAFTGPVETVAPSGASSPSPSASK